MIVKCGQYGGQQECGKAQNEWKLRIGGVQKSGKQSADDTAKGLHGIIESHDQIALGIIAVVCHQCLQQWQADGVKGKEEDKSNDK